MTTTPTRRISINRAMGVNGNVIIHGNGNPVTGTNRNKMGKSRKWNISKTWHIVGKSEVQSSLYCYSVRRWWWWCHCCTPCGQLFLPKLTTLMMRLVWCLVFNSLHAYADNPNRCSTYCRIPRTIRGPHHHHPRSWHNQCWTEATTLTLIYSWNEMNPTLVLLNIVPSTTTQHNSPECRPRVGMGNSWIEK